MEKCPCWHATSNGHAVCWGTKEVEACDCGGNPRFCDFYPYKREESHNENSSKNEYLTRQEIINIVNQTAYSLGKKVPEEFYKQLYKGV